MIILLASSDNEGLVQKVLQSAEELRPDGALSASVCKDTNMQQEYDNKAKAYPVGPRYKVDNVFLGSDADIVSILEPSFTTLPTRKSMALWTSIKPRSNRALTDMALSMQSDHYLAIYVLWDDETDDAKCGSWLSNVMKQVGGYSIGSYLGEYDFQARGSDCWGDEQYHRLVELKCKWDPDNRICGCLGLAGL